MKRTMSLVGLLVVCGLIVTSGERDESTALASEHQTHHKTEPSITVGGEGKVSTVPDMAQVRVGVVTEASTAVEAMDSNTRAVEGLMSTLRESSVADRDIKTSNFSVRPRYSRPYPRDQRPPEITGYMVSNTIRVKIRDLDKLGKVLDQVIRSGANQQHRLSGIDGPVAISGFQTL